jgi:hypothetical protein
MAEKSQPQTVKFVYKTDAEYSTKYVDGATASVTPGGNIHVAFFLERMPYFQEVIYELSPDGNLGQEISRKLEFEAVCRHQQVGVILTPAAAEKLVELLQKTAKQMNEVQANAKAPKATRQKLS